jgi:hypothetical protein
MMNMKSRILAGATSLAFTALAAAAAHADALPAPSMAGPLAADTNPYSVDLGQNLGKVYVGGAISGLGYVQSNPIGGGNGDADSFVDLNNGMAWIENTDGWLQFFAAVGVYSFPTVGVPYEDMSKTMNGGLGTQAPFGYVPVAYAKVVGQGDWSAFSIQAGKLPTLIGDEYAFTFQNMNIERGLLWNYEPIFSRGVQVNYSQGPLTISASWNDGVYSGTWNNLSGLISYAFNGGADTLAFTAGGQVGGKFHLHPRIGIQSSILNYGSVYDIIYTHTSGPWTISPYFQLNVTPDIGGGPPGTTQWGAAILTSYSFDDNFKIAGRIEYTSSGSGGVSPITFNYGPGSNAFTLAITPTYQWKWAYARAELSYVTVGSASAGFGPGGTKTDQFRGLLEIGALL